MVHFFTAFLGKEFDELTKVDTVAFCGVRTEMPFIEQIGQEVIDDREC